MDELYTESFFRAAPEKIQEIEKIKPIPLELETKAPVQKKAAFDFENTPQQFHYLVDLLEREVLAKYPQEKHLTYTFEDVRQAYNKNEGLQLFSLLNRLEASLDVI